MVLIRESIRTVRLAHGGGGQYVDSMSINIKFYSNYRFIVTGGVS